jgi:hypothetical protein
LGPIPDYLCAFLPPPCTHHSFQRMRDAVSYTSVQPSDPFGYLSPAEQLRTKPDFNTFKLSRPSGERSSPVFRNTCDHRVQEPRVNLLTIFAFCSREHSLISFETIAVGLCRRASAGC